jgi:hypothetical protein
MKSSDIKGRKTFTINEDLHIKCRWINTNYGFKHDATYYENGWEKGTVKACYYNRTWESFEYETVVRNCLAKYSKLTEEQQKVIMDGFRSRNMEEVNSMFGNIGLMASIGNLLCDKQEEKNDWKLRMIKAGVGDAIIMPPDWESLPEGEKEERLNKIISAFSKPIIQ